MFENATEFEEQMGARFNPPQQPGDIRQRPASPRARAQSPTRRWHRPHVQGANIFLIDWRLEEDMAIPTLWWDLYIHPSGWEEWSLTWLDQHGEELERSQHQQLPRLQ